MGINVRTIRSSFELLKPIANQVVDVFYKILCADFPDAKPIFATGDVPKQKAAFIGSLIAAVDNLDKPNTLTKFLLGLGERQAQYGVEDIHYDWVSASLLKAFRQSLGDQWSTDLESQWAEFLGILCEAMKAGARNAKSSVRPIQREPVLDPLGRSPTPVKASISDLSLPDAVKQHIQSSVDQIVQKLIQAEVKRCFEGHMQKITQMSPEELVKKAS